MQSPRQWWLRAASIVLVLLLLILADVTTVYGASTPTAKLTKFDAGPSRLMLLKDSDVALMLDSGLSPSVWRSENRGRDWKKLDIAGLNGRERAARILIAHPFVPSTLFLLTSDKTHYKSINGGAHWQPFDAQLPYSGGNPLAFHAEHPDLILYQGIRGFGDNARETWYTRDLFSTPPKILLKYTVNCVFARSTKQFQASETHTILCSQLKPSARGNTRLQPYDLQLVTSDDYFRDPDPNPVNLNGNLKPEDGILGVGVVQKFITVATRPKNGPDLDLWVSLNSKDWAMAQFPLTASIKEDAYTLLESKAYSLTVDVLTKSLRSRFGSLAVGSLYVSNSNGTYFREALPNTNRDMYGIADVERVDTLEGVMLANKVANWDALEQNDRPQEQDKQIVSRISWDEGSSWHRLPPPEKDANGNAYGCNFKDDDSCSLHLHSVTDRRNAGKMFSSKSAPGLLMGVGNVGSRLTPYDQGDLFISNDAGVSWRCARMGAHLYQSSDSGSIIVAADDEQASDKIAYSLDRGVTWEMLSLEQPVRAAFLIADPSSLKPSFLLIGLLGKTRQAVKRTVTQLAEPRPQWANGVVIDDHHALVLDARTEQSEPIALSARDWADVNSRATVIIQLDFSSVAGKCASGDMEDWSLRALKQKEQRTCAMGRTLTFNRRKQTSKCLVGSAELPVPKSESCECTDDDFEWHPLTFAVRSDYNFVKNAEDRSKCDLVGDDPLQPANCPAGTTYKGSSGFRKIPGNACKGGKNKEEPVERQCTASQAPPGGDKIKNVVKKLEGDVAYVLTLRDSPVILLKLERPDATLRSSDNGESWQPSLPDAVRFFAHDHDNTRVYALTKNNEVFLSTDAGATFPSKMPLPAALPSLAESPFDFHPEEKQWLLYKGCQGSAGDCRPAAFVSQDDGKTWSKDAIAQHVDKCLFSQDVTFQKVAKDAIFCSAFASGSNGVDQDNMQLLSFGKLGDQSTRKVLLEHIIDYFVVGHFLAAAKQSDGQLHLMVSTDGDSFVEATFPPNRKLDKREFTILNSVPSRVFLDILRSSDDNREHGALFISNENGTSFSISLDDTNRGRAGGSVVDFERVPVMDSVVIANKLLNGQAIRDGLNAHKSIGSYISFTDGGQWHPLVLAKTDLNQVPVPCGGECTVHIHNRVDTVMQGGLASVSAAPGILLAVGNIGASLGDPSEGHMFLSRNGGRSWLRVHDGPHMPVILDSGGLLVLLKTTSDAVDLEFSYNYGKDWHTYQYTSTPARVQHVITDTHGSRSNLVLYIKESDGARSLVYIDFKDIFSTTCSGQQDESASNDFERWVLTGNTGVQCNLGQKTAFWRRKLDKTCQVAGRLPALKVEGVCECTKSDFDCDTNFFRNDAGQCVLMGEDPMKPANCVNGTEYESKSGYRRISVSKCTGGIDYERPVKRVCGREHDAVGPGIQHAVVEISHAMTDLLYFQRSETVIMLSEGKEAMQSDDAGKTWMRVHGSEDLRITAVQGTPYRHDWAYLLTDSSTLLMTKNKGQSWQRVALPRSPVVTASKVLTLHPDEPDWMLFLGAVDCSPSEFGSCRTEALYSKDGGSNWHSVATYVRQCQWARTKEYTLVSKNMIICDIYRQHKGDQRSLEAAQAPVQLVVSDDYFSTSRVALTDIIGSSIMSEYLVSAASDAGTGSLQLIVSPDGYHFNTAEFMPKLPSDKQGYTILKSHPGTLFIDVLVNTGDTNSFGTMFRSDGSGLKFTMSVENTNRNPNGFVDYERFQGIEGAAIVNRVVNADAVKRKGEGKQLETLITRDDGASWKPVPAPEFDANGDKYDCKGGDGCRLHLHSYTERRDSQNLFDSQSAPGLFLGVGNVGDRLQAYADGNVYATRDGGRTWKEIARGAHQYEFGDYGTLLVLADDEKATTEIKYSVGADMAIRTYTFADAKDAVRIMVVMTEPLSTSSKLLLYGVRESDSKYVLVHLDFGGLERRQCVFSDGPDSDYELWNPAGGDSDQGCLFGHKVQYYRRKPSADCSVGTSRPPPQRQVTERCACTRADYECDFNYVLNAASGQCVPAPGFTPPTIPCDGKPYQVPSRLRKHPLSDCVGGEDTLDQPVTRSCLSHLSGGAWAAIILVPFVVVGIGMAAWMHWRRGGEFRIPAFLSRARTFQYVQLRAGDTAHDDEDTAL
ncbi:vacuolar protein sorting/targeting protein PEP1 [Sorochytrium milnesiophthora]